MKNLLLTETHLETGVQWGVSFAGSNPPLEDYVGCASREDALRLLDKLRDEPTMEDTLKVFANTVRRIASKPITIGYDTEDNFVRTTDLLNMAANWQLYKSHSITGETEMSGTEHALEKCFICGQPEHLPSGRRLKWSDRDHAIVCHPKCPDTIQNQSDKLMFAARQPEQDSAIVEVAKERRRQLAKWGPNHDDAHTTTDFVKLINGYATWADIMADMGSYDKARRRLIQVAALAVAAVERLDRNKPPM